jgi:hypothetical protein
LTILTRTWITIDETFGFWHHTACCDQCHRVMDEQVGWIDDPRDGQIHWCPFCAFRAGMISGRDLAVQWQRSHGYPTSSGYYVAEMLPDDRIAFVPTKKSGKKRRMVVKDEIPQRPSLMLLPGGGA